MHFTATALNGKPLCSYTNVEGTLPNDNRYSWIAEDAASQLEEKLTLRPGLFPLIISLFECPFGKEIASYLIKRRVEVSYFAESKE